MRIAQIAPLFESVPPRWYGGTERVVAYLTDELVRMGHDVTLFASGDSTTRATLVSVCPQALRLDPACRDYLAWHIVMVERAAQRAGAHDLLHFHIAPIHHPIVRRLGVPHVTTLHGRLDLPELQCLYREFADAPVISISDAQRAPIPHAKWVGTVPHGLPVHLHRFHPGGEYFAFMGRISPEKRVDRAIAIAKALGRPLRIAAKIDKADEEYFEHEIRPLFDDPLVRFIGEIGESDKEEFLGGAAALLFPVDWPEPFGLVMIEALACGTPVVAFRCGSVPEVIDHGVTGFVVDTMEEAIDAAARVRHIDRRACREVFERRFTARRMALNYLEIYEQVVSRSAAGHAVA
jgi:glycosyltransferase involved in cell wall biosynthesis